LACLVLAPESFTTLKTANVMSEDSQLLGYDSKKGPAAGAIFFCTACAVKMKKPQHYFATSETTH